MSNENDAPTHIVVAFACGCQTPGPGWQERSLCDMCRESEGFLHHTITIEALAEILRKKELI